MSKENEIAISLNEKVGNALAMNNKPLFEKAFAISSAVVELKAMLTPQVMKPIMALQGNTLGFKTDKDRESGYPEEVVKNCIIEATLSGFEVVGNQFNIISGQMYGTKNGFGHLLKNFPGLHYEISFDLPRINAEKTSAAVMAKIYWEISGTKNNRKIEFPINMNKFMGADAVLGKAERKARKWLYTTLTGTEIGEGDVQDVAHTEISSAIKEKTKEQKETERLISLIESTQTLSALQAFAKDCTADETQAAYNTKLMELTPTPAQQAVAATEPAASPVEDLVIKNINAAKTLADLEQLLPHLKLTHQGLYNQKKIEIGKKISGQ